MNTVKRVAMTILIALVALQLTDEFSLDAMSRRRRSSSRGRSSRSLRTPSRSSSSRSLSRSSSFSRGRSGRSTRRSGRQSRSLVSSQGSSNRRSSSRRTGRSSVAQDRANQTDKKALNIVAAVTKAFENAKDKFAARFTTNAKDVFKGLTQLKREMTDAVSDVKTARLRPNPGIKLGGIFGAYKNMLEAFKKEVVFERSRFSANAYLSRSDTAKAVAALKDVNKSVQMVVRGLAGDPRRVRGYSAADAYATKYIKDLMSGSKSKEVEGLTARIDKAFKGFSRGTNARKLVAELRELDTALGQAATEAEEVGKGVIDTLPDMQPTFTKFKKLLQEVDDNSSIEPVFRLSRTIYLKADDQELVKKELSDVHKAIDRIALALSKRKPQRFNGYKEFQREVTRDIRTFKDAAKVELAEKIIKDMADAIGDVFGIMTTNAKKVKKGLVNLNKAAEKAKVAVVNAGIKPSSKIDVSDVFEELDEFLLTLNKKTSALDTGSMTQKVSRTAFLDTSDIDEIKAALVKFDGVLTFVIKQLAGDANRYSKSFARLREEARFFKRDELVQLVEYYLRKFEKAIGKAEGSFEGPKALFVRNSKAVIKVLDDLNKQLTEWLGKVTKAQIDPGPIPSEFMLYTAFMDMLRALDAKTDINPTGKMSGRAYLDDVALDEVIAQLDQLHETINAFCQKAFRNDSIIIDGLRESKTFITNFKASDLQEIVDDEEAEQLAEYEAEELEEGDDITQGDWEGYEYDDDQDYWGDDEDYDDYYDDYYEEGSDEYSDSEYSESGYFDSYSDGDLSDWDTSQEDDQGYYADDEGGYRELSDWDIDYREPYNDRGGYDQQSYRPLPAW